MCDFSEGINSGGRKRRMSLIADNVRKQNLDTVDTAMRSIMNFQ